MKLEIRDARPDDVPELAALLNEIVTIGGTTAREDPISEADFTSHYLQSAGYVSCVVAVGADGVLYGFQALERMDTLPDGWADIGSFARVEPRVPGVGRAMFAETIRRARAAGVTTINARIRADNVPGLGYYTSMGFVDYDVIRAQPLKDGRPMDRLLKRYDLA
ncbi:MAG: GNAT family N-acetyltransferase [Pseudomonadota bacterium]